MVVASRSGQGQQALGRLPTGEALDLGFEEIGVVRG
jgi:hypothetical protein